jgi:hypothetical protein
MTDSTVTSGNYVINTTTPGGPLAFEAESLVRVGTGATTTTFNDANTSGGVWVELTGNSVGDYIEFTVPNVPAGAYSVKMRYKGWTNRGILNLRVNGTQVGTTLDEYSAASSYPERTFGNVSIGTSGNQIIRLTVTGKNAASSSYVLSADLFTLTPVAAQASAPTFSPAAGTYVGPQNVTISSSTSGATIRYTTDGSTPTATTGTVYSGPVRIATSATIRAIAIASGMTDSTVSSAAYTINPFVFEAESLVRVGTGATTTTFNDANTSGGTWVELTGNSVGDYIEFTVPNIPAGTYEIRMRYKGWTNRGILNLKVDGVQVGTTLDEYSAASSYPERVFGTVALTGTSNRIIRLTVTGKNAASSSYVLSADMFRLVPTN